VGVSGGAAVFRFHGLFANTFYADEALFATWARLIAVWRDPLLQTQPVDKPPLLFYLQALFYPLQGPVEWAARLPNFIASILCVPLVGVLAWRLYRDERTAVFAAAILALSPVAIQFSSTAFTDPLLTTFLCASLVHIVTPKSAEESLRHDAIEIPRRRWLGMTSGWAGVLFGLAVATKYQAVLFLPLVVGTAVLCGWRWRQWRSWLLGLLSILLLLFLWDVARTGTLSLWSAQISNYGGVRLIWSWELWPRLVAWWQLWRMAWGTAVVGMVFWLLALWSLFGIQYSVFSKQSTDRSRITDHWLLDTLFILFIIAYLALHWLLAVPVWDRYLLPLWPLTAVILARGLTQIMRRLGAGNWRLASHLSPLALLLLLLIPAFNARQGQPTADQGTAQIATLLADAPYGTVLYDHWYSWHWRYQFFDKGVYVNWFPHPEALVEDLAVFGRDGKPHYLVLPQSEIAAPIRRAVTSADFALQPLASDDLNRITLYAIVEAQ
jgi:4-amino-4-deoxy-L-arabinose transferase-like glycosyltransferase